MELLKKEEFYLIVKKLEGGHWTPELFDYRWQYHLQTLNLIKELGITNPKDVLEMGTMGVKCVHGSDTIDYAERWDFPGKKPTYLHDARIIPWLIEDKQYELFIALRVYMHLVPKQAECVREAMRIAKKVVIAVPSVYKNEVLPESKGITYEMFVEYMEGIHPNIFIPSGRHDFYFWDTENPSYLRIDHLMETKVNSNVVPSKVQTPHMGSLLGRMKNKIKNLITD